MKYEIAITGSSRPSVYPIFWESFNKMVKMEGKPKITAYEDVIFRDQSNKVKNYIKPKVDDYIEIQPNRRLGYVLNMILNNVKTQYFVYLQEDWKFLKEIDIDKIIKVMDENPRIKQVWFPKKLQKNTYKSFCGDTINISGCNLVPYNSWAFLPNISRTDFVRDIWKAGEVWKASRPESPFKKALQGKQIIPKKIVSYILGEKFDEYIQHLGLPSDDGIQFDMRSSKMIERRNKGYKK